MKSFLKKLLFYTSDNLVSQRKPIKHHQRRAGKSLLVSLFPPADLGSYIEPFFWEIVRLV